MQDFNWGVRLGLNVANAKIEPDSWGEDYKSRIGFHVGLAADYELIKSLYLESGLSISTKYFNKKALNSDTQGFSIDKTEI